MELVERCWDTYNDLITGKEADRDYNNIKTWFKNEEDYHSITMCAKTTVKAPIMTVLSVFGEVDLIDTFIESFEKFTILGIHSPFRLLTLCQLKMPLFIHGRDIIAMGIGIPCSEEKSVMLALRSLSVDSFLGTEIPKETSDFIRIILNFGFYLLTYIDENTTEFSMGINIDPKVDMIPWFILNTFLKEVAYYIALNFKERMEKLDTTIYDKRREERKDFYKKIEERIIFIPKDNTTELD